MVTALLGSVAVVGVAAAVVMVGMRGQQARYTPAPTAASPSLSYHPVAMPEGLAPVRICRGHLQAEPELSVVVKGGGTPTTPSRRTPFSLDQP